MKRRTKPSRLNLVAFALKISGMMKVFIIISLAMAVMAINNNAIIDNHHGGSESLVSIQITGIVSSQTLNMLKSFAGVAGSSDGDNPIIMNEGDADSSNSPEMTRVVSVRVLKAAFSIFEGESSSTNTSLEKAFCSHIANDKHSWRVHMSQSSLHNLTPNSRPMSIAFTRIDSEFNNSYPKLKDDTGIEFSHRHVDSELGEIDDQQELSMRMPGYADVWNVNNRHGKPNSHTYLDEFRLKYIQDPTAKRPHAVMSDHAKLSTSTTNLSPTYSQAICAIAAATTISTIYPAWKCNANTSLSNYCDWSGIACDVNRMSVKNISLSNLGLSGTLPKEIGKLSSLTYLGLSNNKLFGPLPAALANMTSLNVLLLSQNKFTGVIPTVFTQLSSLKSLGLYSNRLNGTVPTALGMLRKLENLWLSHNMFTGMIPTTLGPLTRLSMLGLGFNNLIGTIPTQLGKLLSLHALGLSHNMLTGVIPNEIGQLLGLFALGLQYNDLTGILPTSLGKLKYCRNMGFSHNILTGVIPTVLGQLPALSLLGLGTNKIGGSLPTQLGKLVSLQGLGVSHNKLTGVIPSVLGQLTTLTFFSLHHNRLVGTIPTTLALLRNLQAFELSRNKLTGVIPSVLGQLTRLTTFSLSSNSIGGKIPSTIAFMSKLYGLDLSSNVITGTFPYSIGMSNKLARVNLARTQVSGAFPDSICNTTITTMYLNGSQVSCYPLCLNLPEQDFFDTLPHCLGDQDEGLCGLNEVFRNQQIINNMLFAAPGSPFTYQSIHPRSALSDTTYDLVSVPNAFLYTVSFDGRTQAQCPIKICYDQDCKKVIGSYSSSDHTLPGLRNTPSLDIYASSFYIVSYFRCSDYTFSYEWGYRAVVQATTHGLGWTCTAPPSAASIIMKSLANVNTSLSYAVDPCNWTGVTCGSDSKSIVSLSLKTFGIRGKIPSSLQVLTTLTSLDLSFNSFTGTLPVFLSNLPSLRSLILNENHLSGTIPTALSTLTDLTYLSVSGNGLSGSIPLFLKSMTKLKVLSMKANQFSGKVPLEMCSIVQTPQNTSFSLQNNPRLTCYESCWRSTAVTVFDGDMQACAPTNMPTSSPSQIPSSAPSNVPTSPTVTPSAMPTTLLRVGSASSSDVSISDAAIGGITAACFVIFMLFVGVLCYVNRKVKRYPDMKRRAESLNRLPIHKAIYKGREITRELIMNNLSSAKEKDFDGKTVIDLILDNKMKCNIDEDLLYLLVEDSLPFDKISGETKADISQHNYAWPKLIQKDDIHILTVVDKVLSNFKAQMHLLAHSKNEGGRACIDVACVKCQMLINRRLYLHQRYELYPTYEHRSSTCEVWICKYHAVEDLMTSNTEGGVSDKESGHEEKLALKFMKNRDQYLCELKTREDVNFDSKYVIGVLWSYDGDAVDAENKAFREDAILKGFENYPYCLVMKAADVNLTRYVLTSNIAGRDWDEIRRILKLILLVLDHMHRKGVVHGDLKPSNVMLTGTSLKIIDLDASAEVTKGEYSGSKFSTLYSPPELLYCDKDGKVGVRTFERDPDTRMPVGEYPYELLKASPSHDMCTGSQMFSAGTDDNLVDDDDLLNVAMWSDELKEKKISTIVNKVDRVGRRVSGFEAFASDPNEMQSSITQLRNLMSLLLYKDPMKRPSAAHALDHPFLSGKRPARMEGEKPEYDVFFSYRVDSDSAYVQKLYDELSARNLRVWWDKQCLASGRNWEEGFCDGLVKSAYFVCLLSRDAINHPEKSWQNFSKLGPASKCDNVLLEWRLALELKDRGMIEGIYPVFIGDNDGSNIYTNYFKSECHPGPLSNTPVQAVEGKLAEHLDRQALGLPYRSGNRSSVKYVVLDITSNQGGFVEGELTQALTTIANKIVEMVKNAK